MRYQWVYILLGVVFWIGCNDDSDKLTPTTEPEFWYSLPQGDHDYDVKIVDWHERCGFFILYKFEPRDVYFWGGQEWNESYKDTIYTEKRYTLGITAIQDGDQVYLAEDPSKFYTIGERLVDGLLQKCVINGYTVTIGLESVVNKGGFKVEPANEEYVGKQLAWVEEMFFNFYPDSLLRQAIPIKCIMGKNLLIGDSEYDYTMSYNNLIFNHGDEFIDQLSVSKKRSIKQSIHRWLLQDRIFNNIYAVVKKGDFFTKTDYTPWTKIPIPANSLLYSLGVINCQLANNLTYTANVEELQKRDLNTYLYMVVGNSYEQMTKEPANGKYSSSDLTGILHVKKDVEGLIREKYDILIQDLKTIGIDLQEIGDLYK